MNKNLNIIDDNFKNLKINNNESNNNNINFIEDENDCFNSILSLSSSPLPYQFTISSMMNIPQSIPSSPMRINDPKYSECPNAPMKTKSYIVPKYTRNNSTIRKRLSFSELDQDIVTPSSVSTTPSPKVLKSKSSTNNQFPPSSPVQFIPTSSFRNIDNNSCQVPELKKPNRSRLVFF